MLPGSTSNTIPLAVSLHTVVSKPIDKTGTGFTVTFTSTALPTQLDAPLTGTMVYVTTTGAFVVLV